MKISVDFLTLSPAIIPMVTALIVLAVDVVVPQRVRLPWVLSALGLLASLGALVALGRSESEPRTLCAADTGCMWVADRVGLSLQGVALATALVCVLLAACQRITEAPKSRGVVRAVMVLAATAGSVGVLAARDLGSWMVTLELATLPGIALVALQGGRAAVNGAMTLLATALTSFGVIALGAALWFAATGSVMLTGDAVLSAYHNTDARPLLIVAIVLIMAGVGFKLSLAPFHAWTPEAFAGGGSWVAAFLATTSKVGALGAMLVVLRASSVLGSSALVPLGIFAAISMTLGNVLALRSRSMLRLMSFSTVAQAGWVVLPMTVVAAGSVSAAAVYLTLYVVGTLAVFVVLAALEDADARAPLPSGHVVDLPLESMRGLFRSHPLLAGTLALGLLALAGLPPSIVGVVAKIVALEPVIGGSVWWLVVVALFNAVLGIAVYLRWILVMLAPPVSPSAVLPKVSRSYASLAGLLALALVAASVAPQLLLASF